jgi:hypothetical protein
MHPSFLFFHFSSNQSFARQCRQAQIIVRAFAYPAPDQHRLQIAETVLECERDDRGRDGVARTAPSLSLVSVTCEWTYVGGAIGGRHKKHAGSTRGEGVTHSAPAINA